VQIILKLTSDHYEVSIPDILGRRKFATIIEARQVMFWLLKRTCQLSWNETARLVGVKDHGTILHAVRRVTDRRDVYPDFRTDTDHLLAIAQAAIPSIHRPINEKPPTA
jgi:chromosomal replication initiator protein